MTASARRDGTPEKRSDKPGRSNEKGGRPTAKTGRPTGKAPRSTDKAGRPDRAARPDRAGRPTDRAGRPTERTDRAGRPDRAARPADRAGRPTDRPGRPTDRTDRPGRPTDRAARPTDRPGRPADRADRPDRPARATDRTARPYDSAARPDKKKNAKPQRKSTAPPKLSNAKPAKRQYVPVSTEPHKKMPWGEGERLQKVLAKAGVASRRVAEEMIEAGRVEVDDKIVREQGLRIDPNTAVVRVDGVRVVVQEDLVHLMLNKPQGWQSTMSDEFNRPCIGDLVAERVAAGQRLFHVGRLDADTEGLIMLTNDGDLAHRLMHPSFEVAKTYLAAVTGEIDRGIGKQLKAGIELDDGPAKVDKFQVIEVGEGRSLVKVVLHEGRKHIVRRLLEAVGHPVTGLVRTEIGPIHIGSQRPGTLRALSRTEVGALYKAVGL